MHEACVGPVEINGRKLDAVAAVGWLTAQFITQQCDRIVLRVGAQHVELRRRQRRRFIGLVADGEIESHRGADQRENGKPAFP